MNAQLFAMPVWLQGRYGNTTGALVAMAIPLVAMFFCGASSVTSNSRHDAVHSARQKQLMPDASC